MHTEFSSKNIDFQTAITRNPPIGDRDMRVTDAIALIEDTGYLLVVQSKHEQKEKNKEKNDVIGIFAERDLVRISIQGLNFQSTTLQEVMSPVETIQESALSDFIDRHQALLVNLQKYPRYLPILNGDRLIGVLEKDKLAEILADIVVNQNECQIDKDTLQINEQFLRSIYEGVDQAIFTVDVSEAGEFHFVEFNPTAEKLTGIKTEDLRGKPAGSKVRKNYENCLQAGVAITYEECLIFEGNQTWWLTTLHPIRNSASRIFRIVGTSTNITQLKQTESLLDRQTKVLEQLNQELELRVEERTKELKQSEERWQLALEGTNDGIWDWDIANNCVFFSSRWKSMRGLADESIEESLETWSDSIHPDDYERVMNLIHQHFETKTDFFNAEYRVRCRDGSYIWILDRGKALHDDSGKVVRMCGSETDITHRKQAEIDLQESKIRYATLAAASPVAIFRFNSQWKCTYVNDRWSEMTGYPAESALGDGWINALHPEDRDQFVFQWQQNCVEASIEANPALRAVNYGEGRHLRPDGSINWFFVQVAQEFDAEHNNLIGYIGTLTDITNRKEAEIALEKRGKLYRALMDAASDAIVLADDQGYIINTNKMAESLLGYSQEELIEMHISQIHPLEALEITRQHFKQILEENYKQPIESIILRKDGKKIPVEITGSGIEIDGKMLAQGIFRDISDRKRIEQEQKDYEKRLEHSNAELMRATRLKDEFLANMSHELRTPLNAILGMSESLLDQVLGKLNDRQSSAIATIESSGKHLLALINEILELSKIEAGKLDLEISKVDIAELCQSSLNFVKQQAFKKQIRLNARLPKDLGLMDLDERRMRQVLINLLTNAVKFTPIAGQVTLEVHYEPMEINLSEPISLVRSHKPINIDLQTGCQIDCQKYLCISIIDTGIGISEADQEKLFKPFIQIDSSLNRQYEGTGLGLALVKQIAELHGGEVRLRSQKGSGSNFTVRLPYVCKPNDPEPQVSSDLQENNDKSISSSSDKHQFMQEIDFAESSIDNNPLILIAEDNEANIITISSYLEAKNFRTLLAKNGVEAIALTKSHHPDLILMDIQMPVMDGLEAIEQIRADEVSKDVPIIALTALTMEGDREKCLKIGASDYLSKPVKLKQLTILIQQHLSTCAK